MNTIDTNTTRAVRRFAAIVIVGALALSLAAIATLGAQTDATGGFFALLGDYITEVAKALGSG